MTLFYAFLIIVCYICFSLSAVDTKSVETLSNKDSDADADSKEQ